MLTSHAENAHQEVTSAEEEFNNQVGWMTHSVDSSLLSPVIPAIAQMALEQCDQDHRLEFYMSLPTWTIKVTSYSCCADFQICQEQKQTLKPRYGTNPGVRLTTLGHLLLRKNILCSSWNR